MQIRKIIGIFLFVILLSSLLIVVEARRARNANNADNPTDVNLNDIVWKDSEHKKFHEASEILVNWSGETRNLQDLIDNNLISFPYFDGTLMELEISVGNEESYDKYCTYDNKPVRRVLNNYGLSKDAQYVELKEKFDIPTSLVYSGVYDFSCSYGDNEISSKKKVVLTENFTVIGTFKEQHINRIIRVANNYEYSNSDDTFSYMVAMQEGKLVVRVARPENCININRDNIRVPLCASLSGGDSGNLNDYRKYMLTPGATRPVSKDNGDNEFESLAYVGEDLSAKNNLNWDNNYEMLQSCTGLGGNYDSPGCPYCGDGACSGAEWSMGSCCKDCSEYTPSCNTGNPATTTTTTNTILCYGTLNIDLPETFCKIKQCPVYDAKKGLLRKETIYAWKSLNCKIAPGI